jgi:hypothetical protein
MRLSYSGLDSLHAALLERYVRGELDIDGYNREWDLVVELAGWTWDEVLLELDGRWSTPRTAPTINRC